MRTARQKRKILWLLVLAVVFLVAMVLISHGILPHPVIALFAVAILALCLLGVGEGRERPWGDDHGPDIYGKECNCSILAGISLFLIVTSFLVAN